MIRKTLAFLALGLSLAVPSHAGSRKLEGFVAFIQYQYNGNMLSVVTATIRSFDGSSAGNVSLVAASGTDIKSARDLAHAQSLFENAFNNFQRIGFNVNTSDTKNCTIGTTGCEIAWTLKSNTSFNINRTSN